MGLFAFIKNLFKKAEEIETAAEAFVNEVEVIVPETKKEDNQQPQLPQGGFGM